MLAACVVSFLGLCWHCCEKLVFSAGTQEISAISVMRCCWQPVPALSPWPPREAAGSGFLPKQVPSAGGWQRAALLLVNHTGSEILTAAGPG